MADWTTIANSAIDGDSPITQTLMEALRDNPQAIAEGAVGAPRVLTGAINTTTATHDFGYNVLTNTWTGGDGTYSTSGASFTIPAGWYFCNINATVGSAFQAYINATWVDLTPSGGGIFNGIIISDGSNFRLFYEVSDVVMYYKKLTV